MTSAEAEQRNKHFILKERSTERSFFVFILTSSHLLKIKLDFLGIKLNIIQIKLDFILITTEVIKIITDIIQTITDNI